MSDYKFFSIFISEKQFQTWMPYRNISSCDSKHDCVQNTMTLLNLLSPRRGQVLSYIHNSKKLGTSTDEIIDFLDMEYPAYKFTMSSVLNLDEKTYNELVNKLPQSHATLVLLKRESAEGHAVVIAKNYSNKVFVFDAQLQLVHNISDYIEFYNYVEKHKFSKMMHLLGKSKTEKEKEKKKRLLRHVSRRRITVQITKNNKRKSKKQKSLKTIKSLAPAPAPKKRLRKETNIVIRKQNENPKKRQRVQKKSESMDIETNTPV